MNARLTAPDMRAAKGRRKLVALTAYDYPTAVILDRSGVDILLVGDSLAMVVLGYPDTLSVTLEEMLHHAKAVSRAAQRALVVGDLPFGSYHQGPAQAVESAVRMLREGGARAVKVEGADILPQVRAMVAAGIPVMGHLGLTPQFSAALGGFKAQARSADAAVRLLQDALALQEAGCFALVLEAVPAVVASRVTQALDIPTIGIGAGPECDGQVLVMHDMAGLFTDFQPRFVKRYAELGQSLGAAVAAYAAEVRSGNFPLAEHGFGMPERDTQAFLERTVQLASRGAE